MNFEYIARACTLVIGGFASAKIYHEIMVGRQSRMRDEYKFAKEFFVDLNSNPGINPFLREKGYQAIAGDKDLTANEISYLLTLQNPALALRDYVFGREYLEHLSNVENLQIVFKGKYQEPISRNWRKYTYIFFYAVFYSMSVALFFVPKTTFSTFDDFLFLTFICLVVFGPIAWLFLREAERIKRAETLVKRQDKHTDNIDDKTRRNVEDGLNRFAKLGEK